eukprot:5811852-Amphidinium_carterae.1
MNCRGIHGTLCQISCILNDYSISHIASYCQFESSQFSCSAFRQQLSSWSLFPGKRKTVWQYPTLS